MGDALNPAQNPQLLKTLKQVVEREDSLGLTTIDAGNHIQN